MDRRSFLLAAAKSLLAATAVTTLALDRPAEASPEPAKPGGKKGRRGRRRNRRKKKGKGGKKPKA